MIKVCSLFSGSSGNSILISCKSTKILIDAGLSGVRIEKAMESIDEELSSVDSILITHEHCDHIKGAGILSRRYNIPLYANEKTWNAMQKELGKIEKENVRLFKTCQEFEIKGIGILPFETPHDAVESVGFNFFVEGKKVTTATDIGHINRTLLEYLEGSDMILLESNHDVEMLKVGRYPWPLKKRILGERGHLCNEMAGKVVAYLAEKGTRQFLLGHLSQENNFPELAYQTVHNALMEKRVTPGKDVQLSVALRDRVSDTVKVG